MTKAAELAKMGEVLTNSQIGGRRNLILNPKMEVAQRGTSAFSITTAGNTYTLDRWRANASGGGQFSVQQDSDSPTGFINSSKVTVTTADSSIGSSDFYHFRQTIEGYNFAPLGFGASGAKTMTLSFYVRSSVTGTYNILFRNNAGNRGYLTTYTINSADTWEQKIIVVEGDVTGTYPTDNTGSLIISYSFGGNATGTINQWGTAVDEKSSGTVDLIATGSATWYITGVQLEIGSYPNGTPFEHRSFGEELDLCHRYYEKRNVDTANYELLADSGVWTSTTSWQCPVRFKKVMRTAPTITNGGTLYVARRNVPVAITSFNVADNHHGRSALLYGNTGTVTVTAGESARVQSNSLNAYIQFHAEL